VTGIAQSGRLDEAAFIEALERIPDGVTEIYCHPAVSGESALVQPITQSMKDYRPADELAALLSPRVAAAVNATDALRGGFSDIFPGRSTCGGRTVNSA
jgi:hypothetical protein